MPGRQCEAMARALKLYDKRRAGESVASVAARAGVSRSGLYEAIKQRKERS